MEKDPIELSSELLTHSQSAASLLQKIATGTRDSDMFVYLSDLNEKLDKSEFRIDYSPLDDGERDSLELDILSAELDDDPVADPEQRDDRLDELIKYILSRSSTPALTGELLNLASQRLLHTQSLVWALLARIEDYGVGCLVDYFPEEHATRQWLKAVLTSGAKFCAGSFGYYCIVHKRSTEAIFLNAYLLQEAPSAVKGIFKIVVVEGTYSPYDTEDLALVEDLKTALNTILDPIPDVPLLQHSRADFRFRNAGKPAFYNENGWERVLNSFKPNALAYVLLPQQIRELSLAEYTDYLSGFDVPNLNVPEDADLKTYIFHATKAAQIIENYPKLSQEQQETYKNHLVACALTLNITDWHLLPQIVLDKIREDGAEDILYSLKD